MNNDLTIVQINDCHGYLELHPELYYEDGDEIFRNAGGYARVATLIDSIRKENTGGVIALDNGDTFHGTYPVVNSRGEILTPILNEIAFDAMTAHWEFAYGPEHFIKLTDQLEYPNLAINCHHKKSDELVFPPYRVLERSGVRAGIMGIAATIVDKTMPEHFSEGIYLTLGKEELPEYIEILKTEEKVDLVVLVSHLGLPQELQLASEIEGIDVLLSGHTHNRIYEAIVVNDTVVIQSGCHGSFIGRLDLEIDGGVKDFKHQLLDVDESITPHPDVDNMIGETLKPHREMLGEVIGETKTPLTRNTVIETTMDNLLLQSLIDLTGSQLAFSNGWRYGAPVPRGPVTTNDLWNIIPTNPPVSVCEIGGEELWTMMEENLERTFSRNPYKQMGGYVKRCLGLNIYFKVENPEGNRIEEFFVGDERLERSKTYTASFVTSQGVPLKYGTNRRDLDYDAIDSLSEYIVKNTPVSSELQGTVVPI